jgi:phage gpG-like protein
MFEKLREKIIRVVSDEMKQAEATVQIYIQDYLHGAKQRTGIRKSKSGKFYGGRNNTDKLYSQTGKLLRALAPNGKGHIYTVESQRDGVLMKVGVDLNIVPYARIHEFGGVGGNGAKLRARPYLKTGVRDFVKEEMDNVLKRIVARLDNE